MPDQESRPEKGAQSPEPGHEEPEVVAGRGQNGIDRVAMSTQQATALYQAVALQVPNHGLDGVAPAQFTPDRGRGDAARVRNKDLGRAVQLVTPIAPIHVGPLHQVAGQALNLLDLSAGDTGNFAASRSPNGWPVRLSSARRDPGG